MKIAVIGATGLVGREMLQVIEEFCLPVDEIIPVASSKSIGKTVLFDGNEYPIEDIETCIKLKPNIALFSAGSQVSLDYAQRFADTGTTVIDNSSAWRMRKNIKLVVPEINAHQLKSSDKIIANPNCSTIQLVVAIAPLHKAYKIKRIVASTYQSVSGSGMKGIAQMENERKGDVAEMCYPHPIDLNCIPHGGFFDEDGYTSEEIKLVNETRKILDAPEIAVTATVVRVPVKGGHSISANIEFEKSYKIKDIGELLTSASGVVLYDDPANNVYPMPLYAQGRNEVFVGRIRKDLSCERALNMWIVADNLRKGAATNAVQIAQYLIENNLIS